MVILFLVLYSDGIFTINVKYNFQVCYPHEKYV